MTHLPVANASAGGRHSQPLTSRMSVFKPLPLGQRIPASLHAVSCSLPTMRDVRGYEEKDPAIVQHLTSGYPRFVVHPLLHELAAELLRRHGLNGHALWLVSSAAMAERLANHLGAAAVTRLVDGGLHGIAHPESPELRARARIFLQNVGGFLSSRAAAAELTQRGIRDAEEPEERFHGDALAEVRRHLRPAFPGVADDRLLVSNCGMNAVDAAFRTLAELQAAQGRTVWIQLGWLYLDTIALLQKFTRAPGDYVRVGDVFDLEALEQVFARHAGRVAGIVAEVPTNPLLQTPDVPRIAEIARRHGARVILDPSISSAFNTEILSFADVVVCSLTKYTASAGDLAAGLAVVNPALSDAAAVHAGIVRKLEPIHPRDLSRLAVEIARTGALLKRVHASVPRVVAFLEKHPAVGEVFWALRADSRENYLRVARSPDAVGAMITFTLRGSLEKFYDRLRLPKGPSFGMETTLICPFMYLAHYDLVTTEGGRAQLAANGLDPDLLRLSIGTEPVEDIIATLAEALA
ncbi:MAG: Cys/Met metabolism pyridoxal-phosphate-dependent protein [Verrucomicrobia bacterium]|nr:Cys/Met metabolism pyridoxal-phosphate-dependent protein [Verrucomicrobiota bacterium]